MVKITADQHIIIFSFSDKKPPSTWPKEGKIVFSQVTMAYASSLPPVLKNLSFTVQPREKVISIYFSVTFET